MFGSPTYIGAPAWQFKRFADESSKRWFAQAWKDKVMGGFTNSASLTRNKESTLRYFTTLAAQHGALWVNLSQPPAHKKDRGPEDRNYAGSAHGAMAISPEDSGPEEAPSAGDLESARDYGARIARFAAMLPAKEAA